MYFTKANNITHQYLIAMGLQLWHNKHLVGWK